MSVKVVKRITEDVKEFDNKEDFIKFYELNKNELKDFSTCILNKKFKIKGYHLGREKGELKLIPLDLYRPSAYRINQEDNQISLKIDVLNDKLESLKKDLNDTKQYMLKMFNNFNQFLSLCQVNQS
jgi:hypothetical protein